jgi:hypothetical protein
MRVIGGGGGGGDRDDTDGALPFFRSSFLPCASVLLF